MPQQDSRLRPNPKNRLRQLLLRGGAIAFGFAIALLGADVYFRIQPRDSQVYDIYEYNPAPAISYTMRANWQGRWHGVAIKTNSHGFRSKEFSVSRGQNTFRILVLGDSVTFGTSLEEEDLYPRKLENMLNGKGSAKRFEIINTGIEGYATDQEVAWLEEEGLRYKPDMVIVGYVLNDIDGVGYTADKCGQLVNLQRGNADNPCSKAPDLPSPYLDFTKSYLWNFLRLKYDPLRTRVGERYQGGDKPGEDFVFQAEPGYLLGFNALYVDGAREWEATKKHLEYLATLTKKNGIALLVVVFPTSFQLRHGDEYAVPQEALRAFGKENDVAILDLLPLFRAASKGNPMALYPLIPSGEPDIFHPNAAGHSLVAEAILERISAQLGLPQRSFTKGPARQGPPEPQAPAPAPAVPVLAGEGYRGGSSSEPDALTTAANLLQNPSFELWNSDLEADAWRSFYSTPEPLGLSRETNSHSGQYAVRLKPSGLSQALYQDFTQQKGVDYFIGKKVTFGLWARSAAPTGVMRLHMRRDDNYTEKIEHFRLTNEYQFFSMTVDKLSEATTGYRVEIIPGNENANNDILVDDATLILEMK